MSDARGRKCGILVLGGRGFIGRHAVAALQAAGHEVGIGSRHRRAGLLHCRLERLACPEDALPLLQRFDVVLNCVGILRERWRGENYAAIHQRAPALLAAACRARGLRYLHVSALGLRHPHRSGLPHQQAARRTGVVAAGGDFRIVRPSLLDGRGGFGALWLRALAAPAAALPCARRTRDASPRSTWPSWARRWRRCARARSRDTRR
jgi:NADH dehydrogenase